MAEQGNKSGGSDRGEDALTVIYGVALMLFGTAGAFGLWATVAVLGFALFVLGLCGYLRPDPTNGGTRWPWSARS